MGDLTVAVENPFSSEVAVLLEALDEDLRSRYAASSIHTTDLRDVAPGRGVFVVARIGGRAVGCGAVRPLQTGVGELKRMWVDPQARRRGIARRILAQLEAAAAELGWTTLRLETGVPQPEAIALYESFGYYRIPCFGEYADDPHSECFEKRLL
jgi:ribosomal protein S18 acetylase RimI-like enzyme